MEEKYLILLQMVSAGQNGPDLGCDEEQIVYLLYAILDVHRNKVSSLNINETSERFSTRWSFKGC